MKRQLIFRLRKLLRRSITYVIVFPILNYSCFGTYIEIYKIADIEYVANNEEVAVDIPENIDIITDNTIIYSYEEFGYDTNHIPINTIEYTDGYVEETIEETIEETTYEPTYEPILETVNETINIVENITSNKDYYDIPISNEDQDFIKEVCEYYNFSEELIYKIMYVESRFDKDIISKTNAHGIMQINYLYYKSYVYNYNDDFNYIYEDGFDIYNIKHNALIGIRQLSYWRDVCSGRGYNNIESILQCYNRGFKYFNNTTNTNYADKVINTIMNKL